MKERKRDVFGGDCVTCKWYKPPCCECPHEPMGCAYEPKEAPSRWELDHPRNNKFTLPEGIGELLDYCKPKEEGDV